MAFCVITGLVDFLDVVELGIFGYATEVAFTETIFKVFTPYTILSTRINVQL